MSGSDVAELVRRHLDQLSPNDRRVAAHLLDHYAEAPFETAESLATKVGVSKAAVVRFATRVGFSGYAELHESLRDEAVARLSSPRANGAGGEGERLLDRWVDRARDDLAATRASVDGDAFDAAVAILLDSRRGKLGIFGHRKSAALAEYAYYLLNPLISNVWPIGEAAIADQLIDLEPGDRLIAFTFQRYARATAEVVRQFTAAGAPSVVVTDSHLAPAAAQATHVLVCRPSASGGFESAASAFVVLEALAAEIAVRTRGRSDRRLDAAEQLWKQFGTY